MRNNVFVLLLIASLLFAGACALLTGSGTFVDRLRADLISVDYVYHVAGDWYSMNGATLSDETRAKIEHLKRDYETARAALNDLLKTYDAAHQGDVDSALKTLFDVLKQILVIVADNKGPKLDSNLPLVAVQPAPASKYYGGGF